jgi:hypothetical protein
MNWRKSTYSADENACVELAWRKSSYSEPENACVELARTPTHGMIRDSKNPAGPRLAVLDLPDFLAAVRRGRGLFAP